MARRTKTELKPLEQFTFKDADDKEQNLDEFFTEDDFYTQTKGKDKKVTGIFVKHAAIQRLAAAAGIKMSEVQMLVQPNGSNEQQHLFCASFTYGDKQVMEIGESSPRNTGIGISRNYMGTMGFKRLFDRGVLNVMGFYELYSQEEADDLNEEYIINAKISPKELEAIGKYLNGLVNATTVAELDAAMTKAIEDKKAERIIFSPAQRNYLRTIYQSNRFNLELSAEEAALAGTAPKTAQAAPEPATVAPDSPIADKVAAANAKLEAAAQAAEKTVKAPMTEEEHKAAVERGEIPF